MTPNHILIVDDEPNVALTLSAALSRMEVDYIFDTAYSAKEALAKLQQTTYALLLTDYNMPGMSGLDLAQAARRISPATQIVVMSGVGTDKLRETINTLRLGGFIDKPFTAAKIREIIKQTVEQTKPANLEADPYRAGEHILDRSIEKHLKSLRSHTGAYCILLLSSSGYAVSVVGQTAIRDIDSVGALVSANFMAAAELAKLLGGRSVFKSSYHEGDDYNIYTYKVNDELLLAVIFGSGTKPGMIWFYTKQTATALLPLVPTQSPKFVITDDINTVLDAEFDQLLGSESEGDAQLNSAGQIVLPQNR